jgi:hypothetical protein
MKGLMFYIKRSSLKNLNRHYTMSYTMAMFYKKTFYHVNILKAFPIYC